MSEFYQKINKRFKWNNLWNYFKSAFKDIFHVVLGILIAVQVNNWNEERKDRIGEQNYLHWLKVDLLKDQKNLLFSRDLCDIRMEQIDLLTQVLEHPDSIISEPNWFIESIEKVTWKSYLPISTVVYDELQNTGTMSLITSKTLREQLANYHDMATHWERILKSLEYSNEFGNDTAGLLNKEILAQIENSESLYMTHAPDPLNFNLSDQEVQTIVNSLNQSNAKKWLPQINHYHVLSKKVVNLLISKNEELLKTIDDNLD